MADFVRDSKDYASETDGDDDRLPDGTIINPYDFPQDLPKGDSVQACVTTGGPEATFSKYGQPEDAETAAALCPTGEGGLIWHAQIVLDDWNDKSHCNESGDIKPRRPILPVRKDDFFSSLVKTADGRWLFSGVLNGWPGLTTLQLVSITYKKKKKTVLSTAPKTTRFWTEGDATSPSWPVQCETVSDSVRATLRSPPCTSKGWSTSSPGYVWWFLGQRKEPLMRHGEDIIRQVQADSKEHKTPEPVVSNIHLFSHRYARLKEKNKDKLTYHSAILLEWDHGRFCTVVELATLNGVGGRMGKVNWCADKMEPSPALYKAMPTAMVVPWKGEFAEIRCTDIVAKNLDEFKIYVDSYIGNDKRFLDPNWSFSAPARLSFRKQSDIVRYLINYRGRDNRYSEQFRHCQAFASDFYGFVAGKRGIVPFSAILRQGYMDRSHLFQYDALMFEATYNSSTGTGGTGGTSGTSGTGDAGSTTSVNTGCSTSCMV